MSELDDLIRRVEQLEAIVADSRTSGRITFSSPTHHYREAVFHTEDFLTRNRTRGIRMVNPANTQILGFIGMRNNANGDFILGIEDTSSSENTSIAFSEETDGLGAVHFRLTDGEVLSIDENATDLDLTLFGPSGKNARVLVGNTAGDIAVVQIQAKASTGTHYVDWNQEYTLGQINDNGAFVLTSSSTLGAANQNVFTIQARTGTLAFTINNDNRDIDFFVNGDTQNSLLGVNAGLDLPIVNRQKTDTGDPTGAEGAIYINTFDNAIRMYAEGAWRTLASW